MIEALPTVDTREPWLMETQLNTRFCDPHGKEEGIVINSPALTAPSWT